MPRQNRVTPLGDLIADPARGALTGNRGVLHDAHERIVRRHQTRRWIACALRFKDRHRHVMPPGRWTALFFLDEATALAAGHRPCAECRRADFNRFMAAWCAAFGLDERPRVDAVDRLLHAQRTAAERPRAVSRSLPDGAFVLHGGAPHLVHAGALWPWAPAGYGAPVAPPAGALPVVTPEAIVAVLRAGYAPAISAARL